MKVRRLIGLVVICGSLLFVAACGDDNDVFVPPIQVPTNTNAPPTNTPTPVGPSRTPTDTPVVEGGSCGDGTRDPGETCDDGNDDGGDGCAANCTTEGAVGCAFGGATGALVQLERFTVTLPFQGSQILTAGNARDSDVRTTRGKFFQAGDIPVVIKKENLNFEPVEVSGLVCACVRANADPELGPGNAGEGVVGCGENGLQGTDTLSTIDHRSNDPDCTADTLHPGVCNGRAKNSHSGAGPKGSVLISTSTSITVINDGGTCARQCLPVNGPDCTPCTDDDPNQVTPSTVLTTTATARAAVFDANNSSTGASIDCGQNCGGAPCVCMTSGTPVADCALMNSNPSAGIIGVKLVGAFGQLDLPPPSGDVLVTTAFECVAP